MSNFITKPALTLKGLFAVAAVATAVVAMPSGPDFAFGVKSAHAAKMKPISKKDLKALCRRVGGEWHENSQTGVYYCLTKTHEVACYKYLSGLVVCWGNNRTVMVTPPTGRGKATGSQTTGRVTGQPSKTQRRTWSSKGVTR